MPARVSVSIGKCMFMCCRPALATRVHCHFAVLSYCKLFRKPQENRDPAMAMVAVFLLICFHFILMFDQRTVLLYL